MSAARIEDAEAAPDRTPTVLVVEDEVIIRAVLAETLRLEGFAVIEAADADEALAVMAADLHADVLITDVRMPGEVDGLQLAARLRQARPGLKIVVTSANLPAERAVGVADAFLAKPFGLEQLVIHVRALAELT